MRLSTKTRVSKSTSSPTGDKGGTTFEGEGVDFTERLLNFPVTGKGGTKEVKKEKMEKPCSEISILKSFL